MLMDQRWRELMAQAAAHHGLFTIRSAEDFGISRQTILYLLRHKGGVRVAPGVYLAAGFGLSARVRAAAIDLAVTGLDQDTTRLGAVSHRAAAAMHGLLPSLREPIDYTAHANCSKRPPRSRIHRAAWLEESMITTVDGIHVLRPEPTFATLATSSSVHELIGLLQTADRLRVCIPDRVGGWLSAAPQLPGLARLADALAVVRGERVHSGDEALARKHLREAGLCPAPGPFTVFEEHGRPIAEIDIAFVDEKVAICIDGPSHDDPSQRRFDDDQRFRLQLLGWLVLRVDGDRLRSHPAAFVARVQEALALRHAAD